MKTITDNEFGSEVLNNKKVVLLDAYATWCGPCKMLAPELEKLQTETIDWLEIVKVDVDEAEDVAVKLNISAIPALFVFKNGEMLDSTMGFKTVDQLREFVESYK